MPARRVLAQRASPVATTSAYTLTGWVRPMSSTTSQLSSVVDATTPEATTPAADATAPSPVGTPRSTTHFRITLRRSAIGLPSKTERIVKALGLKKRLSTVYHEQTSSIAGSILALKEIVHVDNVRRLDPPVGRFAPEMQEAIRAWHASIPDEDAVWVDAQGDVVDWGREAKRAPRGYRVVGNLISEERDLEVRAMSGFDQGRV